MTEVSLSPASRETVLLLQRTAELRQQTTGRLATGQRVERATDDAPAFFQSKALRDRVRDLLLVKDEVGQAVSGVETALVGIDAIEDLTRQLKGLALSVRGASAGERQAAAEQFDLLREQITNLANDAGYRGVELVGASPEDLEVSLNETGSSSLRVRGSAADAGGLGISAAAGALNAFAADSDIDAAVAQLDDAIASLRSTAATLGSAVSTLQVREDFVADLSDTLESGAAKLTDADLNEEGARLLSSQVREQLGVEGLRVASQSDALIANLL